LNFFGFFGFFSKKEKKRESGQTQPLGLGHNWLGPNQGLINWLAACKNEFCMQQPRRGRKRQSWEEEVAWRGGLGRDEVVRPVARGASVEVMVAGVGCGRKKKKLQRREESWKEKREKVTVAALPLMRS